MDRPERALKCPYCQQNAIKATGREVYPHRRDLAAKRFWVCKPCDAYVGCHEGTWKPFGRLADAELRKAKMAAHNAFDPLWREGGYSRSEAYKWLAEQLGVSRDRCHIGLFDLDLCHAVVEVCADARDSR